MNTFVNRRLTKPLVTPCGLCLASVCSSRVSTTRESLTAAVPYKPEASSASAAEVRVVSIPHVLPPLGRFLPNVSAFIVIVAGHRQGQSMQLHDLVMAAVAVPGTTGTGSGHWSGMRFSDSCGRFGTLQGMSLAFGPGDRCPYLSQRR